MNTKLFKNFVVFVFAAVLLLTYRVSAASEIRSVVWNTDSGEVLLSDTKAGNLGVISTSTYNSVTVTFAGTYIKKYASLTIVPAGDDTSDFSLKENAVLLQQQPVDGGKAEFGFYLKPSTADGIYAIYAGGAQNGAVVKYFEVNSKIAPKIIAGQQIQYDSYKNGITLKFDVGDDKDRFAAWTAEKDNMTIKLNHDKKSIQIPNSAVRFDTDEGAVTIEPGACEEIIPASGILSEGNIQKTGISIVTPGYWGDSGFGAAQNGKFELVTSKLSASGFEEGVNFEVKLYSGAGLESAYPIVALYDNGKLVGCMTGEKVVLNAGKEKTIPMTFKCGGLAPSADFSVKVMLWDSLTDNKPLTTVVKFP